MRVSGRKRKLQRIHSPAKKSIEGGDSSSFSIFREVGRPFYFLTTLRSAQEVYHSSEFNFQRHCMTW